MNLELHLSLWTVMRLLVLALLLVLVVRGLRLGLVVAPMSAARRRGLEQAFPIVELLLGIVFLVATLREVFSGAPALEGMAVLGVLFGGLWLARHALTDILNGVLLRTSGAVARGDRVHLDGLEGRVTWLGYRVLAIETRGGDEAQIPYSRLGRQAVVRTPLVDGAYRHTFLLEDAPSAERIRQVALLSHWSSVSRVPMIETTEAGGWEVTVFALGPDLGPEIETYVRKALSARSGGA